MHYRDRSTPRTVGTVLGVLAGATSAGLLISSAFEPIDEYERNEGRVIAGVVSVLSAIPILLSTAQFQGRAKAEFRPASPRSRG